MVSHTTEKSQLLPSQHSSDNSTTKNREDLEAEESLLKNGSEIQFRTFKGQGSWDEYIGEGNSTKRKVILIGALVAVLGGFFGLFMMPDSTDSDSVAKHHLSEAVKDARAPLSLLHPTELGLADFVRPEDSSPPELLSRLLSGGEKKGSFPTNSWYQSMLLVDDEPDAGSRVYAIPYVLDVVGPIPGLRVHPNHIMSSAEVVEVNIQANYGLTVGAAPDAKEKHAHEDTSRRYEVSYMTNLGVTLGWVSTFF
jgi:hypothetical protein